MKHKITTIIASLIAACGLCAMFATPAPAFAVDSICNITEVPDEVKQAAGCPNANPTSNDLTSTIQTIVNSVILVLGTVALIVIVIGGVSYMTSAGDAGKMQKAKNTILYACIGLVISVLSFAIVNFTISIIGSNGGSNSNSNANLQNYDSTTYNPQS